MMDSQVERLWNTGGLAPVVRQKKLLDPLEVESWAMELWKKDMWKSALEEVWGFFKMGTWMRRDDGRFFGIMLCFLFGNDLLDECRGLDGEFFCFFFGGGMMCWILPGNPPVVDKNPWIYPFHPGCWLLMNEGL